MVKPRFFLIDSPSTFAPRPEWVTFLAEMEALLIDNPGNESVENAIRQAKTEIAAQDANQ